ncbi:MAG: peptidylprolyl isomerase [Alphaproteobacteria bacterium]
MTYKIQIIKIFFFFSFIQFLGNYSFSQEKFEGIIASVDTDIITTYDLSQRIKLTLKSLSLDDTIKNRDSIRDRVEELLILEKIKKAEATKNNINNTDNELIEFASMLYNFPKEEFENFKNFLVEEGFDIEILLEQISSELLWKKLLQKKLSSKIVINQNEIDREYNLRNQRIGKLEYNFTEVIFENKNVDDFSDSKKKMSEFLSLLEQGIPFNDLSEKFSDNYKVSSEDSSWFFEDNIQEDLKEILVKMKNGEVKTNIKTENGLKILKLNDKRLYGDSNLAYSFLNISSFNEDFIKNINKLEINCNNYSEKQNDELTIIKIDKVFLNEMSDIYKKQIENLKIDQFSKIIENESKFIILKLCEKTVDESFLVTKEQIEKLIYSKKFNQLANTLMANLRKNSNIKFFNQ